MKINVICSDTGWIYEEFINQLAKHSKHTIVKNSKDKCDAIHYIPYYELVSKPDVPCTAWFSHMEEREDLKKKFIKAAGMVDVAISQSKKYTSLLRNECGLHNVIQIMPGVDLEKFIIRSKNNINTKSKKLIVGHVGRPYTSSNRKNPKLLGQIGKLNFVDFRTTGGKLSKEQIPKFYRSVHVIVSPSKIEGGPMAVTEALASGVPIVCMKDVGVANEFDVGVLRASDNNDFIKILKDMYNSKSHIKKWATDEIMRKMRAQVEGFTWKKFVEEHDKIWDMITTEGWVNS